MPCSFDFNVAATKYFAALEEGEIPLCFLFSGTVFYQAEDGGLQVAPISLEKQADFRLPVAVWKQMMDHYYPHSTWLCLDRDVFDRLSRYKAGNGLPTWEQAIESLLARETRAGGVMNQAIVDKIVQAVLYEGYNLYPYRPSVKSRCRWTFGGLYPRSYSEAVQGTDAWSMQVQCLLQTRVGNADNCKIEPCELEVQLRYLHLTQRTIGRLPVPCDELPAGAIPFTRPSILLQLGGTRYQSWQEASGA